MPVHDICRFVSRVWIRKDCETGTRIIGSTSGYFDIDGHQLFLELGSTVRGRQLSTVRRGTEMRLNISARGEYTVRNGCKSAFRLKVPDLVPAFAKVRNILRRDSARTCPVRARQLLLAEALTQYTLN